MFCGTCGGEVPAGARFCASCGAASQPQAPVQDEPTFRAPTASTTSSSTALTPARTSVLAVVSLVLGISGLCIPVVGGLAAIITGHIARSEIRRSSGALGGRGMAMAGLIIGYASTLLMCLSGTVWLAKVSEQEDAHRREAATLALHEDAGADAEADSPEEPAAPPPSGTSVGLTKAQLQVDGQRVDGVGPLTARASAGALPALLESLRARKLASPTDTVPIQVADDVRFGLLERVLETAQGVPYASVALLEDVEDAEPRFLWDGRVGLGLPAQTPLALTLSGAELVLVRDRRPPVRLSLRRDEAGVWETGPLDDALAEVTEALPDQQTLVLRVADDVVFEDLLEVLDACTYAGLPYVSLRSSAGPR